jgi:DUF1365 family protein
MKNSFFYLGKVFHHRLSPVDHKFYYNFFWSAVDLDEIDEVCRLNIFWSNDKKNISYFRRKDHLGDKNRPLKECVYDLIEQKFYIRPNHSVQLITHFAVMGYRLNPVSFYVLKNDKNQIDFMIAEINNTPWGEQYCYCIDGRNQANNQIKASFEKQFHISPFFSMNIQYQWRFSFVDDQLSIEMENWENQKKVFQVTLNAKQEEMNKQTMTKVLLKYPLITAQVAWGIYWQALRLWLKKAPFYEHPKHHKIGESNVS